MESQYLLQRRALKNGSQDSKQTATPDPKALSNWFATIASQFTAGTCKCWECNAPVPEAFIIHATAHIFPKKAFPSVATHPSNYLILGASCCHDKSHKVETFSKMKIWREAVDRFLEFERHLTKEEKANKYYTLFLEAARQSFPEMFR